MTRMAQLPDGYAECRGCDRVVRHADGQWGHAPHCPSITSGAATRAEAASRIGRATDDSERPSRGLSAPSATAPSEPTVSAWQADRLRVVPLLRMVGGVGPPQVAVIKGDPRPKGRPRFLDGRAYTPGPTREAEDRLRSGLSLVFAEPLEGDIAIACLFVCRDHRRGDWDNLGKLASDAGQGPCWANDAAIVGSVVLIETDAYRPRTVLAAATASPA